MNMFSMGRSLHLVARQEVREFLYYNGQPCSQPLSAFQCCIIFAHNIEKLQGGPGDKANHGLVDSDFSLHAITKH